LGNRYMDIVKLNSDKIKKSWLDLSKTTIRNTI
jgi:hypothetical protein